VTLFDAGGGGTHDGPAVCRLVLAYDGTQFRGFATQPDQRTVASVLGGALTKVLRTEVDLACAGRTDTGVHAWGQVVSFEAPPGIDVDRLQTSLNAMLGPEVVVRTAELVPAGFDARRSATWRAYRYTIVHRPAPDPFLARYAWHVPGPLDLHALRLAADPFVGEHDFVSFCRKGPTGSTTVRRVMESAWHDLCDGVLRYDIRASAFCWRMVRSIVGTIVDAGLGKRRPGDMLTILRAGDRAAAGTIAPAHGLCLWDVGYREG
jgi:tRNA pseudouridine38-40 synthase